ncbi:4-hydroxythreonine-4-phosphate dehydrogenase PdxA [Phytoactinopolyspora endophytica]|uniref:4-hydroxythreonine-4-phosphate dehydrogenase PdxA n=1 Tax=Phytoactinopolyspora endophytica TaxID=1642495 RepID=UPI00101CD5D4|nr:4-hydroxythreonine-4-phosphate dehydrogenase PdxA [Phytoactinopolyspora endophytica]
MSGIRGHRPRIALTPGDPSGIGFELVAKLLAEPFNLARADVSVLASAEELSAAAAETGVVVPLAGEPHAEAASAVGSALADRPFVRGEVTRQAGERALADLRSAVEMYQRGEMDAIVFAPLNKSALSLAGMEDEDELRWFARGLGHDGTTSELNLVPGLMTSRVTSHIPLRDVAQHISARRVAAAIRLLNDVVRASGVERPRLAVCALNPHAGENGKFGTEEGDHIAPGIALAAHEGIDAAGPYPCDTVFIRARDGGFDGVVTMYHDQGQIAMKLMGFDQGVTVQGGLPVPIVTPAHGTAHEIVGQGIAKTGPIQRAFDVALTLAGTRPVSEGH